MFDPQAFQIEMTRMTFWLIVGQAIGAALFFAGLYFAIKAAVRDGINESRLADRRWTDGVPDPAIRDALRETREAAKVLPPMRAD